MSKNSEYIIYPWRSLNISRHNYSCWIENQKRLPLSSPVNIFNETRWFQIFWRPINLHSLVALQGSEMQVLLIMIAASQLPKIENGGGISGASKSPGTNDLILSILSIYSNKNLQQTYHLLHFVSTRSSIAKFLRRGKRENLSVVQSKLTHCKSRTKVISCMKTS